MGIYYLMMFLSFGLVAAIALGGYLVIVVTGKRAAHDAAVGEGGGALRGDIGVPGEASSR